MEGWKFSLIVTLFALAIGLAGAPTWLIYGSAIALTVALLPQLFKEPAPEMSNRRAVLRGFASDWLGRGVFISLLAIAAGVTWLAVAAVLFPLTLMLLTTPRKDR